MFDVVVIGGGYAGLTAATYLVRSRRHVCVIDNRRPRNRFAAASHGFLGHDGASPVEILERARDQLHNYPLICTIEGEAVRAEPAGSGFTVHLADGEQVSGRRIILAFGLTDNLPVIDGLSERWGKSVFHCPYCHGLEYSDRRLGVLYRLPMSVHQAMLVAEWGPTTLFLNGATLDAESADALAARGIAIDRGAVAGLSGDGESLAAVLLEDGRSCPVEALYVAPRSTLSSPIAAADADSKAALATFDGTVLRALEETETALTAYAKALKNRSLLTTRLESASRASRIVRSRQREGTVDFLAVIDAERSASDARTAVAENDARFADAQISLFRALAGGWTIVQKQEQ